MAIDYQSLLKEPKDASVYERIGRASAGNIDKTGCFYHVITKSNDGATIFHTEAGSYRHNLLCRLCEERGITILFSVTMPNHTHDVFLTPRWELLAEVLKNLHMNLTKFLRRKNPKRYKEGIRILRRYPTYIAVRSIVALFYLGKYIYDNPEHLRKDGKYTPNDCFWMFEKEYFPEAYDITIYKRLFNLTPKEILDVYSRLSADQVMDYARKKFAGWTEAQTKAVFYKSSGNNPV
ncbi:MAG: transposase [Spirochaetales bacterium]|nr:transposase [Spirochaetales bacterium]